MKVDFDYGPFNVEAEIDSYVSAGVKRYHVDNYTVYSNGQDCTDYLKYSVLEAISEAAISEID